MLEVVSNICGHEGRRRIDQLAYLSDSTARAIVRSVVSLRAAGATVEQVTLEEDPVYECGVVATVRCAGADEEKRIPFPLGVSVGEWAARFLEKVEQ